MSANGIFIDSFDAFALNETPTFTDDFEIPPSTVVASTSLTSVAMTNDGWVFSGILEFRKRNPKTGKDHVNVVGTLDVSFSLAKIVADNHVDSVTFGLGVWDFGGSGLDFATTVQGTNQVWVFS